jgi:membrane-bound serine protease (ClpP class)
LVTLAVRLRQREPVTGKGALIGQIGEVRRALDPEGQVFVAGALWSAWSDDGPVPVGELVEVADLENLRLYVRRLVPEHRSG